MTAVDLTKVSSAALRAELTRRQHGARAKGKPLKYPTKAAWAAAKAAELRTSGGAPAEVQKFEGLAKLYEQKGI